MESLDTTHSTIAHLLKKKKNPASRKKVNIYINVKKIKQFREFELKGFMVMLMES